MPRWFSEDFGIPKAPGNLEVEAPGQSCVETGWAGLHPSALSLRRIPIDIAALQHPTVAIAGIRARAHDDTDLVHKVAECIFFSGHANRDFAGSLAAPVSADPTQTIKL